MAVIFPVNTSSIGIATGTSLALGGATIGTDALAITGTVSISGNTTLGSSAQLLWSTDLIVARAGAATIRLGAGAVDTGPVAQTISVQNVLTGGTADVAGANLTIAGSQGKGTGVGGAIILSTARAGSTGSTVNALTPTVTIGGDGTTTFAGVQLLPDGAVGAPSIGFSTEPTTGIYKRVNGVLDFSTAGTLRFEISGTQFRGASGAIYGFGSGAASTTMDTGYSRVSAGIHAFGTGAAASVAGEIRALTGTFGGTVATAAPAGSSAGLWKLGALQTAAVVLDTTRSIFVDIGGTVYKLMVAQ